MGVIGAHAGTVLVDGRVPSRIACPTTPAEAAEVLLDATRQGAWVFPVGAGTHQRVGASPDRVDIALSTRALGGILRYDPDDLVVSVGSGTRLDEVQTALAERGQRLPVEAPGGDGATLGGLLALGLNGSRALGSPTLRDLLIGMAVAQTDGTVARSGGMVVKNVTGMDMGRLHVGARGTLGLIVSANFKVLPIPETETTVDWLFASGPVGIAGAAGLAGRIRASALRPVACEIGADRTGTSLTIRFEGRRPAVRRQVAEAMAMRPGGTTIDGEESAAWWRRFVASLAMDDPATTTLRLEARPREMDAALGRLVTSLAGDARVWRLTASPGAGLAWLRLSGPDADSLPRTVGSSGLVVTLATGPIAPWRRSDAPDVRDVDRALRDQFDPGRIMNRGRFD